MEWNWEQQICRDTFINKYQINEGDKCIEDVFIGVSEEISRIEKEDERDNFKKLFFNEMASGRLIPGGRILANARLNSKNPYYNNCYTIDIEDSMEDIYESLKKDAIISSTGGGVGFNVSKLRPEGEITSKGGISSGPISFLNVFNESAKIIQTGGFRRAAHIAILDVDHPDILKFITYKQGNKNKNLQQFNISVRISDKFIEAVEKDLDWNLKFNGKIYNTVKARSIYEAIVKNAFEHNEPGVFFGDRVEKDNNAPDTLKIDRCNPCFTGDTLVAVADGRNAVSIKQLAEEGKDVPVYAVDKEGSPTVRMMRNPRITGYDKEVVLVELDNGYKIRCTPNHKFILSNGTRVEAKDLKENDSLMYGERSQDSLGKLYGIKQDSWWKSLYDNVRTSNGFMITHHEVSNIFYPEEFQSGMHRHHKDFNSLNNHPDNIEILSREDHLSLHLKGDNNPMRRWYPNASEEEKLRYHNNMSNSVSGLKNPKAFQISNDEILDTLTKFIKEKGRSVGFLEAVSFFSEIGFPSSGNNFRNYRNLIKKAHERAGIEKLENKYHQRTLNSWENGEYHSKTDLPMSLIEGEVFVHKECEICGKEILLPFQNREVGICLRCSIENNHNSRKSEKRELKRNLFIKLINNLSHIPSKKEWNIYCREEVGGLLPINISEEVRSLIKRQNIKKIDWNKKGMHSLMVRKKLFEDLQKAGMVFNHKIKSVSFIKEKETVYNGTVDELHNFAIIAGSNSELIFTQQCGEISMPAWNLCNLSSLNFVKFVNNPFHENAYLDFKLLENSIKIAIRFLDNVLDATKYPIEKIEIESKKWRRIGLGFTGFADMLAMLRIPYDSDKALKFTEDLAEFFRNKSYETSSYLAKERGSYPEFRSEEIQKSGFFKKLPKNLKNMIKENGLRNIGINTVAPTGTGSFTLGNNCSSGIEPIFSLQYERKIRKNQGEEIKTETVYDSAWLNYITHISLQGKEISNIPDFFVTAQDIDPYKAIEIQAIWQYYIDHSISKTANLPKGYSIEDYKNLFLFAHKKGLKGLTTYNPEGSISGVLSVDNNIGELKENDAPKRPEELPCDIHQINVKGIKHIVLCGFFNGKLYEVFVTTDEENKIDLQKYNKGFIKKIKSSFYELSVKNGKDKVIIPNIGKAFDPIYGSLSRMISMSLRHGASLRFVVEQLQKDSEFISFERAVSRVLKKYIKDGNLSTNKCTICGETLQYKDGCLFCPSCGDSKCS